MNGRRTNLTIYSNPGCPFSHQVRLVINEKHIDADIINQDSADWPEDVAAANPYHSGPTLLDRNLSLFNARIIIDYLDERFPHPSLMPADPVERAQLRLMIYRIERDWYSMWDALNGRERGKASKSRRTLQEDLTVLAPLFSSSPFLMSNDMTLLDCCLAPLLWHLPALNVKLPASAKAVEDYAQRIFQREAFQASLTDTERAIRP